MAYIIADRLLSILVLNYFIYDTECGHRSVVYQVTNPFLPIRLIQINRSTTMHHPQKFSVTTYSPSLFSDLARHQACADNRALNSHNQYNADIR